MKNEMPENIEGLTSYVSERIDYLRWNLGKLTPPERKKLESEIMRAMEIMDRLETETDVIPD